MPAEKVRVITPFVGGGFGGASASAQAIEAARLAKIVGKPVMVMWSREEEFLLDAFRPAAVVKISSGLDDAPNIAVWDYHVYFAGQRGCENFCEIPHHREAVHGEWRTGPVLATAVHDATGAKPPHLPMTPDRVKAALQRK